MDEKRELLRHTLATVAYRAARASKARPITLPDLTALAASPYRFWPTWATS